MRLLRIALTLFGLPACSSGKRTGPLSAMTLAGTRYSTLKQIDASNVGKLVGSGRIT